MLPALYRAATAAAAPLVVAYLGRRRRYGKEDPARFTERLGQGSLPRPPGPLVWMHAASVGEALSVLSLIERMLAQRPGLSVLMTTGTVGAARLIEPRLPPRARHQYVPVDLPDAVKRFLDHWRPDLAVWVESELWPNLVLATARRRVPMLLLNARLSAGSYARWRVLPGLARPILSSFALCLAQDDIQAGWLRELGAADAACLGDLKTAGEPLAAGADALAELRRQAGDRPCWLAASTHPGEEEVVANAHRSVAAMHPGLLTIVAPRHPGRGAEIAAMLGLRGLGVARRSQGETIAASTDIYLVDTLGEMGLFYRLAGIALIGGSLASGAGGHNPFEAARLDCAILHGPDMRNSAAMARAMQAAGAAEIVGNADELAAAISRLIADPAHRDTRARAAARAAEAGRGVLEAVLGRIAPWLDPLAAAAGAAPRQPACEAVAAALDARA